ncbi:lysozyme [Haloechinothrix sp. LS1_15]|nr:lysozyme [Haloechinothrix sp. LS1_15]
MPAEPEQPDAASAESTFAGVLAALPRAVDTATAGDSGDGESAGESAGEPAGEARALPLPAVTDAGEGDSQGNDERSLDDSPVERDSDGGGSAGSDAIEVDPADGRSGQDSEGGAVLDVAVDLPGLAERVVTELASNGEANPQHGIDVSGWQGRVDWEHWWDEGKRFAYIKATEGTTFVNSDFDHQYSGAYDVGMIRGAYHFALPDRSAAAVQARHFVRNGGDWSPDGRTLPGVLDIEFNPYGQTCYRMSQSSLVDWIVEFHDTYHELTGRYPVIYTNTMWWERCVGDGHDLGVTVPLWIARYADDVGNLPAGWDSHAFWQYTDTPLDKNEFNGSYRELIELATG